MRLSTDFLCWYSWWIMKYPKVKGGLCAEDKIKCRNKFEIEKVNAKHIFRQMVSVFAYLHVISPAEISNPNQFRLNMDK